MKKIGVGGGDGKLGIMRNGKGLRNRRVREDGITSLDSRSPLFVYVRRKALGTFTMNRWMHTAYRSAERMSTASSSPMSFSASQIDADRDIVVVVDMYLR